MNNKQPPLTGTFNVALGPLPVACHRFLGTWLLSYMPHAKREATRDRYGVMLMPYRVEIRKDMIVEAEFVNGNAVKCVVRLPVPSSLVKGKQLDLVLVLCDPFDGEIMVKTIWFNERNDNHATLKTDRLVTV